ncbi:MAG: DNA-formamidopyrimidine glycosylase, partial [Leucobacter sp.]|nr:DNA-formamidopyrimidine glycosylase [Leucobacter sp.]
MPELPEVEVVRAGLAPAVTGAHVISIEVKDHRALKRHVPLAGDDGLGGHGVTMNSEAGVVRATDFERRMTGVTLGAPARRGKFLWLPVDGFHVGAAATRDADPIPGSASGQALLAHLGMSGQLLLRSHDAPDDRHVRVRLWIEHPTHGELRLDFADQRLFGSLALDGLVATSDGAAGGLGTELPALPGQAAHIARDPLDPAFQDAACIARLRMRNVAIKSALLDQSLLSGVGNIYADEALWRARVHPQTLASGVTRRKAAELLAHLREVFAKALAEGGTSFDEQYVNVNGQAGYFAHSLNAYGRGGE